MEKRGKPKNSYQSCHLTSNNRILTIKISRKKCSSRKTLRYSKRKSYRSPQDNQNRKLATWNPYLAETRLQCLKILSSLQKVKPKKPQASHPQPNPVVHTKHKHSLTYPPSQQPSPPRRSTCSTTPHLRRLRRSVASSARPHSAQSLAGH